MHSTCKTVYVALEKTERHRDSLGGGRRALLFIRERSVGLAEFIELFNCFIYHRRKSIVYLLTDRIHSIVKSLAVLFGIGKLTLSTADSRAESAPRIENVDNYGGVDVRENNADRAIYDLITVLYIATETPEIFEIKVNGPTG